MKTFTLIFQVENADELLTQMRLAYEEMSTSTQRRFIDSFPVDGDAQFVTGYDGQPVVLTRPD